MKYYLHTSLEVIGAAGFVPDDVLCEVPEELKDKKLKVEMIPKVVLVPTLDEEQNLVLDENQEPVYLEMVIGATAVAVIDEEKQTLYDAQVSSAVIEGQWLELRLKRDKLLQECDFTQLPDAPLTAEKKAEYTVYRQALRDLPDNTLDPLNPIFPQKPV